MTNPTYFPLHRQASLLLEGPIGQLEVLTTTPESPRNPPVIAVICHPHPLFGGNLNNKVIYTLARSFQIMGLRTLRFNFRGVGKSQGQYDHGNGETDDLLTLLQWLKITCPDHAIWLAGFSFGAYVAARSAKKWPVEQIVCIAPPIENFPFTTLHPFPCPWLLIQGDKDEIVSPTAVFSWIESLETNSPHLIIIKGASHFFHGHLIELREHLIAALASVPK
ncbi:MAG: alpha/beta fold hydrolase [Pseudomonadota bacterium]